MTIYAQAWLYVRFAWLQLVPVLWYFGSDLWQGSMIKIQYLWKYEIG